MFIISKVYKKLINFKNWLATLLKSIIVHLCTTAILEKDIIGTQSGLLRSDKQGDFYV